MLGPSNTTMASLPHRNQEYQKYERYCREQREIVQVLEGPKAYERTVYKTSQTKGSGDDCLRGRADQFGDVCIIACI